MNEYVNDFCEKTTPTVHFLANYYLFWYDFWNMSKVVYVGGFGNGQASAEKVASALESYYEGVESFTFSEYAHNPTKVRLATKGVDLVTHSAGALALSSAEVRPSYAHLLNPPLPRTIGHILMNTLVKTARMNTPGAAIHSMADAKASLDYSKSSLAELAAHPYRNFSNLKRIAGFNAINAASDAQFFDTPTKLVWTTNDAYFQPTLSEMSDANQQGLSVALLDGEHDEVVLHPGEFLDAALNS